MAFRLPQKKHQNSQTLECKTKPDCIPDDFSRQFWIGFLLISASLLFCVQTSIAQENPPQNYSAKIQQSRPILYLPFSESPDSPIISQGTLKDLKIELKEGAVIRQPGPRPEEYPDFEAKNFSLRTSKNGQYLSISHSEQADSLQFKNGDQITLEAWIRPQAVQQASFPYVMGKGRTGNSGFPAQNQNYSLRLAAGKTIAPLSFFFADEGIVQGGSTNTHGHRWTSKAGVPLDHEWHHVALVYEFGKPESIVGYIDGKPTEGTWDLAGPTTKPPVHDQDELWIGASMKGGNTFLGQIDEVAIHRQILTPQELASRFRKNQVDHLQLMMDQFVENAKQAPQIQEKSSQVQVNIHEGIGSVRAWKFRPTPVSSVYETDSFFMTHLPRKYNSRGIITDREGPLLLHFYARISLPEGTHQFVVRSLNSARFYVDNQLLTETPFMRLGGSAHGKFEPLQPPLHGELSLDMSHNEQRIEFVSDGKPHLFSLLAIVGHGNTPAWPGELTVSVGQPGQEYYLFGPEKKWPFTDSGWLDFQEKEAAHRFAWNSQERKRVSRQEQEYWRERHEKTRKNIDEFFPPVEVPSESASQANSQAIHPIDAFISQKLKKQSIQTTALLDDWKFLRRATLDLIGTNPTAAQIEQYWSDPQDQRRSLLVERLLKHPDWADHWVPYWQDVLAENPGITKPSLNNSGPFRWYLHEAFSDNRSLDRIATELILMEGSRHEGGTAGFAVASNNDVPMAEKAHILGTAFLGVEMKCARCHDAPHHNSLQRDLFEVAAMLERKPVKVPLTSSIPGSPEKLAAMTIQITLKPGSVVDPKWPFSEFFDLEKTDLNWLVRDSENSREVLAAAITSPGNKRFAEVSVNRVWKRLIGRGIVSLADDWETGEASHPELLSWLSREFVLNGYDLKSLTKLIVSSELYQREPISGNPESESLFSGPTRKRLTAEQMFDTVYQVSGKPLPTERLTLNQDNRLSRFDFIDFGRPQKAWELVSISNDRERPSMGLPQAQSVVDFLASFGWRSERQDPLTDRENLPTAIQPLAMANGTAMNRAFDISEHSTLVDLCLESQQPEELLEQLFQRILCRPSQPEERQLILELISPGFEARKTGVTEIPPRKLFRSPLAWTNQFDPAATTEGIRQQEEAERGDQPTKRLKPDWRERAEDTIWILFNTPEFAFVP